MSYNLDVDNFAELFGVDADTFSPQVLDKINLYNFKYNRLGYDEYNELILKIVKRINTKDFTLSGPEEKERWVKGWGENLQEFIDSGHDLSKLVPKYVHPYIPIRLFDDYVKTEDPDFELNFLDVYRTWLFETYFSGCNCVYEFGCGSGYNLTHIAEMYPNCELHGLDWVEPSKQILEELKKVYSFNTTGHIFNMFNPDYDLEIKKGSAFLAIGALEQLGRKFEPFLQFILAKKPSIVVHVDSFVELYPEDNLSGYLAIEFDKARNYLQGYLTRLACMHQEQELEILKTQYVTCGSLYHSGYSFIVWRPK